MSYLRSTIIKGYVVTHATAVQLPFLQYYKGEMRGLLAGCIEKRSNN